MQIMRHSASFGSLVGRIIPKESGRSQEAGLAGMPIRRPASATITVLTVMLRSKNPYLTFARAIELFYQPPKYAPGIHSTAVIHSSTKIGKSAHIGPYAVVDEDVLIGENAVLLAHVVIYRGARIGDSFFA